MSDSVQVHFVEGDGSKKTVSVPVGKTILEVVQENGIDLACLCGGSLACSTCHVVVDQEHFDLLPKASEEEEDMLDLAFGLKPTSRLGCQLVVTKEMDGLVLVIPQN